MDDLPMTMTARRAFAVQAFHRDVDAEAAKWFITKVPRDQVPENATPVEAYETATHWIILGTPSEEEDENSPRYHDCDTMGCGTFSHVIARLPKP